MALIERLMGIEEKIPVHDFFAAIHQRVEGALTKQNIVEMFVLSDEDIVDYDALAALAPTGVAALNVAQKAMYIDNVHAVLTLAEGGYAGYDTPALVRTKLGI